MSEIDKAYATIRHFERQAKKFDLKSSDLQKVLKFMSIPSFKALQFFLSIGEEKSPTAQFMANYKYEDTGSHPSYRSDSFCIAQYFDLDKVKKKESSLWIIENAMAGYYDHITREGFKLTNLLSKMQAMDDNFKSKDKRLALNYHRINKLANGLNLTGEDLCESASNVINWCLVRGYRVQTSFEDKFGASVPFDIVQAEGLSKEYLSLDRQELLEPFFEEAKDNTKGVTPLDVIYRHRM